MSTRLTIYHNKQRNVFCTHIFGTTRWTLIWKEGKGHTRLKMLLKRKVNNTWVKIALSVFFNSAIHFENLKIRLYSHQMSLHTLNPDIEPCFLAIPKNYVAQIEARFKLRVKLKGGNIRVEIGFSVFDSHSAFLPSLKIPSTPRKLSEIWDTLWTVIWWGCALFGPRVTWELQFKR